MYGNEYFDEIMIEDIHGVSATRISYKWLKWLLAVFLLIMPAVILFSVQRNLRLICLLAYVNCVVIGFGTWRFLCKGTLAAFVPVMFVPWVIFGWPVGMLYFAIFRPTLAYYSTMNRGDVSWFDAGVRIQLCVLLFITAYFGVLSFALRKEHTYPEGVVGNPRLLTISALCVGLSVVFFHSILQFIRMPAFIAYLINGFVKYLHGLLFVVGAFIKRVPVVVRIIVFGLLGLVMLFYAIGGGRGLAVLIIVMFVSGLLFFSEISQKTRLTIILCLCFALPMYMLISNTARILIGTAGFEDFGYRWEVLKEWRAAGTGQTALTSTLQRLFSRGGHALIAFTPTENPYRYFKPFPFIRETFESLIPQVLYYRPYYRGTYMLNAYGIRVDEYTSVELSMIGSLWLLGGYLPVFFGGIALGLLHWLVVKMLQHNWTFSKMKAFIYFGVLSPGIVWAPNYAIITHWRYLMYRIMLAFILYNILRFVIGDPGRGVYQLGGEDQMVGEQGLGL